MLAGNADEGIGEWGFAALVETTAVGDGSWTPERAETVLRYAAAVFNALVE